MTNDFCDDFENLEDCESAAGPICSWYTSPKDCNETSAPSTTTPPSPTHVVEGCCTGNSTEFWPFCSTLDTETECTDATECEWIITEDPLECEPTTTTTTNEPTFDPTVEPTFKQGIYSGCCLGLTPQNWTYCSIILDLNECMGESEYCHWLETEDPMDCLFPTPSGGPTLSPTVESGCCTGSTPEDDAFCSTLDDEGDCVDTEGSCTWIVTDDPSECGGTHTPSGEPTATPSAWIEGCCSGIDNIDDSWCAQFEDGPSCEANPQCWWIDGGMRLEAHNDGVNLTTQSPAVSPTDPTAFPSQIPTTAPSKTPTWFVTHCLMIRCAFCKISAS